MVVGWFTYPTWKHLSLLLKESPFLSSQFGGSSHPPSFTGEFSTWSSTWCVVVVVALVLCCSCLPSPTQDDDDICDHNITCPAPYSWHEDGECPSFRSFLYDFLLVLDAQMTLTQLGPTLEMAAGTLQTAYLMVCSLWIASFPDSVPKIRCRGMGKVIGMNHCFFFFSQLEKDVLPCVL